MNPAARPGQRRREFNRFGGRFRRRMLCYNNNLQCIGAHLYDTHARTAFGPSDLSGYDVSIAMTCRKRRKRDSHHSFEHGRFVCALMRLGSKKRY